MSYLFLGNIAGGPQKLIHLIVKFLSLSS